LRLFMNDAGDFPFPVESGVPDNRGDAGNLWNDLGGGRSPFLAEPPDWLDAGFWHAAWCVAEAPASQYDVLRRHAATDGGLPGNVFCLAGTGSGFHGQSDRSWSALAGNLHLTVGLTADLPAAEFGPVLPALPALAALDVVRALAVDAEVMGIKWVNDVLAGPADGALAKCAGVLTSARSLSGRIDTVFLGIGLNVAGVPQLAADPFVPAVCCLDDFRQQPAGLGAALRLVLESIATRWRILQDTGPISLAAAYREASVIVGRRVQVWADTSAGGSTPLAVGTVSGLGDDLSLHLEGRKPPVTSGRIVLLDP